MSDEDPRITANRAAVHRATLEVLATDGIAGLSVDRLADVVRRLAQHDLPPLARPAGAGRGGLRGGRARRDGAGRRAAARHQAGTAGVPARLCAHG